MAVYHIMADGTRRDSIEGHVVKIQYAEPLYRYLHSINQKRHQTAKEKEKSK